MLSKFIRGRNFSDAINRGRNKGQTYYKKVQNHHYESNSAEPINTFASRAEGMKNVKEFMKHVHPDFFANAPQNIRDANQSGVQEINEYIQSLKNFGDGKGVKAKNITFFLKSEDQEYTQMSYQFEDLRDGSSPDLKHRHFEKTVEGLMDALGKTLDRGDPEESNGLNIDEVDRDGYQFYSAQNYNDTAGPPSKNPL